jgi:hypothetical protein
MPKIIYTCASRPKTNKGWKGHYLTLGRISKIPVLVEKEQVPPFILILSLKNRV